MGKVYDALRRADSERQRRGSPSTSTTAATPGPWRDAEAEIPAEKRSRLRRWLSRSGRQSAPRPASSGDEINKRRLAILQPESFATEQFRTLRARLDSLAAERPIRTLSVASSLPGEGKTLAAANLALVTAMGVGRRVLLVDCDLRRPQVHASLGIQPVNGLGEVLTDAATLEQAIHKVEGVNLEVLPVRTRPPNPSELLASDRMRTLVEELARSYDRVIFDTPACLGMPDAKTVSELTDGLVFVVRADMTPQEDVNAALDLLDRRRVLGVVLNGAEVEARRYGY